MTTAAVLAHQGGWDEAVLVALPLIVLFALLRMARKRAAEEAEQDERDRDGSGPAPSNGAAPRRPDTPSGG